MNPNLSPNEKKSYDKIEAWIKKNPDSYMSEGFKALGVHKIVYYTARRKLKLQRGESPVKRYSPRKSKMQTLIVPEPTNVILMVVPVSEIGLTLKSILGGL